MSIAPDILLGKRALVSATLTHWDGKSSISTIRLNKNPQAQHPNSIPLVYKLGQT